MSLYPYQQDVVDGALALWQQGKRRIAGVVATGGGKTHIFSEPARLARNAGRPTLVIAHRKELLTQAIAKLTDANPNARIGLLQGTTKQYRAEIVVASVQTASTDATLVLLRSRQWGLIIIDECHHAQAATYQKVLRELGAFEPDGPLVLGMTATLDRADGLALGDTFEAVIEPVVGLRDLIERGFLVRPRGVRVRIAGLDTSKIRKVAGDFKQGQLGAAMTASMAPQRIVDAWAEHAAGRPTVAFLPTVAVSLETAEAFRAAGFTAVHVDAKSSDEDREAALKLSAAGDMDVVCNVNLFGEGTDMPWLGCVILRMTSSGVVYTQQIGRGLRRHPGKEDCIILDPTGVTGRHNLNTRANLDGAAAPDEIPDDLLIYEDGDEPVAEADEMPDEPGDGPALPEYVDGDLAHELFDLFGESPSAWLRTTGGTWFLPVADGFVYLDRGFDAPGLYALCWHRGHRNQAGQLAGTIEAGLPLPAALAAGDAYVMQFANWQADRAAAWRSVPVRGGRTKGQDADDNAIRRASALLDKPAR